MPNRDIGIDVKAPAREAAPGDRLNPFNGSLPVRGSVIVGTVVSARMQGTAIVQKERQTLVQKFERIERRSRRYAAHVPSNIDVAEGDEVVIAECRPISKTVHFVVVENRGSPAARKAAPGGAASAAPAPAAAKAAPAARPAAAAKPAAKKPAVAAKKAAEKAAAPEA